MNSDKYKKIYKHLERLSIMGDKILSDKDYGNYFEIYCQSIEEFRDYLYKYAQDEMVLKAFAEIKVFKIKRFKVLDIFRKDMFGGNQIYFDSDEKVRSYIINNDLVFNKISRYIAKKIDPDAQRLIE